MITIPRKTALTARLALCRQHKAEHDGEAGELADLLHYLLTISGDVITLEDDDARLALAAIKGMWGIDLPFSLERDLDYAHNELSAMLDLREPLTWPGAVAAVVVIVGLLLTAVRF